MWIAWTPNLGTCKHVELGSIKFDLKKQIYQISNNPVIENSQSYFELDITPDLSEECQYITFQKLNIIAGRVLNRYINYYIWYSGAI